MNKQTNSELSPIIGEKNYVVVDNGYAQQKIAFWGNNDKGEKVIVTKVLPSRAQMGRLNIAIDGKTAGVYEVDDMAYTVGESVLEPEQIRTKAYAHSELNTALVTHSIVAAGYGGQNVTLATGLPFDHYYRDGRIDNEFIAKVTDSLQVPTRSLSDEPIAIIVGHKVYAESTAAYIHHAFDHLTGDIKNFPNGLVVVDMGGNTTDITMINGGDTPSINTERSGSKKLGVLNILDSLSKLIKREYDLEAVTPSQVENALRTGSFQLFGKTTDVKDLVEQAKKVTVKRLINYVNETIGDGSYVTEVLFVGGGAEVLKDIFLREFENGTVGENPEFANAIGMLKYLTFLEKNI